LSVLLDGSWQQVRFHDYDRIFTIPGLYEQLFHDILDCRSPDVIGKLLKEELQRNNVPASSLRVLDLGAGNGVVGEQLRTVGVGYLRSEERRVGRGWRERGAGDGEEKRR